MIKIWEQRSLSLSIVLWVCQLRSLGVLVVTWFCLAMSQERDGCSDHGLTYENRELFFYSSCG